MNNRRPIFSTKGRYSNSGVFIAIIIYIIAYGGFLLKFPNALESPISYLVTMCAVPLFGAPLTRALQMKKSYIELYDDYITGFTVNKNSLSFSEKPCQFSLRYTDIIHTNYQSGIVEIYFSGGSYCVQAKGCEQYVIDIINSQRNGQGNAPTFMMFRPANRL